MMPSLSLSAKQSGVQGALLAGAPVPIMLAYLDVAGPMPPMWRLVLASASAVSWAVCAIVLLRLPRMAGVLGGVAALCSFLAAWPHLVNDPFAALLGLVALISAAFALIDFRPGLGLGNENGLDSTLHRARWAAMTVAGAVGFSIITAGEIRPFVIHVTIVASALIAQLLFMDWAWRRKPARLKILYTALGLCFAGLLMGSLYRGHTAVAAIVFSLGTILLLSRSSPLWEERGREWEMFLQHPARLLFTTFFLLCFLGALLLIIPGAAGKGEISLVDAAFTAVSAVCVTGLVVLDTPEAFTFLGQAFILLLIQLGGVGIMSIAAVALNAMGRRLSLRQERLLTNMTDTDHQTLVDALVRILKFTFVAEGIGALMLTGLFYASGDAMGQAAWRGLFTAVSAFCNAGFALQSDNMIPYQNNPFVLHTVAGLIIFGGMAPATSLISPKWLMGRRIPIAPRIALTTTAVMLISGTFFFLAFEWNGVLSGLSVGDKIHNAWFQSATLRTAGFNSVDVAGVISPTFMVMIWFMFIGGSPGGTAGGVKTTTIGILAMTFWANINNRNSVIFRNRRLPSAIIYRAITIVGSVAVVWFAVVLMLEVTQQISGRDIIFEATSAIGTVGLSTGATAGLDEIGKVIIMMAMFAGRVGPMTLFMVLSEDVSAPVSRCPDAKITLS